MASPMPDTALPVALTLVSTVERYIPDPDPPAQVKRMAVHGQVRSIGLGEALVETGERVVPFFLVTAGRLEIVRPSGTSETLVALFATGSVHRRGQPAFGPPRAPPSARQ